MSILSYEIYSIAIWWGIKKYGNVKKWKVILNNEGIYIKINSDWKEHKNVTLGQS